NVTSLKVPPPNKLEESRLVPSAVEIVPFSTVPVIKFQDPVRASRVMVLPVLSIVPVTLIVPSVRLKFPGGAGAKMPLPAVVNEPPRFSVPPLTVILPVFDQES